MLEPPQESRATRGFESAVPSQSSDNASGDADNQQGSRRSHRLVDPSETTRRLPGCFSRDEDIVRAPWRHGDQHEQGSRTGTCGWITSFLRRTGALVTRGGDQGSDGPFHLQFSARAARKGSPRQLVTSTLPAKEMKNDSAPLHGACARWGSETPVRSRPGSHLQSHGWRYRWGIRLLHRRSRAKRRASAACPPQARGDDSCPERPIQNQDWRRIVLLSGRRLCVSALEDPPRLPQPHGRTGRDHRGLHAGGWTQVLRGVWAYFAEWSARPEGHWSAVHKVRYDSAWTAVEPGLATDDYCRWRSCVCR